MKKYQYRAIHVAITTVWGKPNRCELCKGENKSKRFEWASRNHKYTFDKREWWQLCAKCHRRYDRKKFGHFVWNKGLRKARDIKPCFYCGNIFAVKRREQIFCSRKCAAKNNGLKPKRIYLKERGLM